ncbi:GntR family transcriptional regulator [Pseudomonas sp. NPDC090202]|uniref:GntR family transcriptional regulator n=1 Tax=unclassified Pseudomonas TaxID=196821 RepID=UPI003811B41F
MSEVLLNALGPCEDVAITATVIAERIIRAITSGALPVGTQVRQQVLADHFKVSRMPVREALRQLQAQGVITAPRHRTPVVAQPPEPSPLDVLQERVEELIALLTDARAALAECVDLGDLPVETAQKARRIANARRTFVPALVPTMPAQACA